MCIVGLNKKVAGLQLIIDKNIKHSKRLNNQHSFKTLY
jgi:hypothetical protein